MSGREDIAGAVGGAPALLDVYIVSTPDGLLVRSWQRSGERDGEAVAAHVGQLVGSALEMLGALSSEGAPDLVSVESGDRVVLVSNLARGLVVALVFDRATPLGLARIEARDLVERIRGSLSPKPKSESDPLAPPRPSFSRPVITPVPPPPDMPRGVSAIVAAQAPTQPDLAAARRSPHPSAPILAPVPPLSAVPGPPAVRAAKLIDALRAGSADVHTALLRVSLRTGIPVEILERPDSIEAEQVDAIAGAVRDLLGRDPLA